MIKVGCCGYPVGRKEYQKTFRLVEINRTFYTFPRVSTVARWREEAPVAFEFSVKAHQEISHKHKLKLELSDELLQRMKEICRILKAAILLIQTPASFRPERLKDAENFFRGISRDELTVVWETRGPLWERAETRDELRVALERLDIPHVTDPLKILPVYTGNVPYFRLHGHGPRLYYYQYTDDELRQLHDLVSPFDRQKRDVYVLFNNLSMFEDAKRFVSFIESGRFPSLAGAVGLDSLRLIIEKSQYPITKALLIKRFGWRLVELDGERQVRLEGLLKRLPSRSFKNPEEVLRETKL